MRTSAITHTLKPPPKRAAIPGIAAALAQLRAVFKASKSIEVGCSRRGTSEPGVSEPGEPGVSEPGEPGVSEPGEPGVS
ncbi:MAG: hypothetical protein ACR2N0_02925, partial [Rubrobacteraceae bacterium]